MTKSDDMASIVQMERANDMLARAIQMTQTVIEELNLLEKQVHESHMRVFEACLQALQEARENGGERE